MPDTRITLELELTERNEKEGSTKTVEKCLGLKLQLRGGDCAAEWKLQQCC